MSQSPATPTGVHPALRNPAADFIGARAALHEGATLRSHDPARPDRIVWSGDPDPQRVDEAVAAARVALGEWASWTLERRVDVLRAYQKLVEQRVDQVAELLCDEVGKPLWEAAQEAKILAGKVDITLDDAPGAAMSRVSGFELPLGETKIGRCFFRPHGVMAVIGPFNFPAHLPNGHIIPALAMGDTVVLKPSDKTPATGQMLAELLREALDDAGAPLGVVNLVQGAADVASRLVTHEDVDGVAFTGSWPVGRKILEANLDTPGRIIALELGGNNPAIVMDDAHLKQAVLECARAAFATAGQRCTCTRRIIIHRAVADRFIEAFLQTARSIRVGDPRSSDPVFCGPVIRAEAQQGALRFADRLADSGAETLLTPRTGASEDAEADPEGHYLTPGVFRVDHFTKSDDPAKDAGCDVEVFGPLVRLCVVDSLEEAIDQANATNYGLAASIFTTSEDSIRRFLAVGKAGCLNVNTGTAGASGKLPFGGLGRSGNHRPAGAFSVDYCAYPVASMIEESDAAALSPGMAFDDAWIR
jgi:succinylglutamic semialdehyde dehydrogenase